MRTNNDETKLKLQKQSKSLLVENIVEDMSEADFSSISSALNSKGYTRASSSSKQLLSPSTCEILKQTTIPNLFRGNFDTNIYPDEWHWREGISRDEAAREMCNTWKSSYKIASIVLNEKLGEFVARVMGWDSIRIAQDDIVWKPPQKKGQHHQHNQQIYSSSLDNKRIDTVGFHQDSAYISTQFNPYENNSVALWMALDDADEENGCLEYAVGSHLWKPILRLQKGQDALVDESVGAGVTSFHESDESSYRNGLLNAARTADVDFDDQNPYSIIERVPVNMGHAVLHHQDVWHGSGPNTSHTRHRRALVAHYLRGDVEFVGDGEKSDKGRFRPPFGKTSYIYGRYKRYQSLEVDETFFPIIYGSQGGLKRTEWLDQFLSVA